MYPVIRRAAYPLVLWTVLAGSGSAQDAPPDPGVPTETSRTTERAAPGDGVRATLAAEIARLERDIATLDEFLAWQARMAAASGRDPRATLRQRRAMSQCLASPLAPVCHHLSALFAPGTETARTDAPAEPKGGTQ